MLKMAAFQQTSYATLPHHFTTHQALLLPQATNMWAPTSLVPKRAHQSLQCHFAPYWGGEGPKMASFSNPPAGLWPAPSRCSYIFQLMFPQLSVPFFFFFWPTATTTSDLYPSLFPSCYLLSGHSLNRLELSASSYARSGQGPDHASSGTVQY